MFDVVISLVSLIYFYFSDPTYTSSILFLGPLYHLYYEGGMMVTIGGSFVHGVLGVCVEEG